MHSSRVEVCFDPDYKKKIKSAFDRSRIRIELHHHAVSAAGLRVTRFPPGHGDPAGVPPVPSAARRERPVAGSDHSKSAMIRHHPEHALTYSAPREV